MLCFYKVTHTKVHYWMKIQWMDIKDINMEYKESALLAAAIGHTTSSTIPGQSGLERVMQ